MLKVGLCGLGRWGKAYIKTIRAMVDCKLHMLCSRTRDSYDTLELPQGDLPWTDDYRTLCTAVDAVIIATPPQSHYDIACYALANGKHVICEKPLTLSLPAALRIKELVYTSKLNFLVAYTHLWQPDFRALKEKYVADDCFTIIHSEGMAFGPFTHDYPVLWDWGSHDVAMCLVLCGVPHGLDCLGSSGIESNMLTLKLEYPRKICWINIGNYSSNKRRRFALKSVSQELVFEDNRKHEPLLIMLQEFSRSVLHKDFLTNIDLAVEVTAILAKLDRMLR